MNKRKICPTKITYCGLRLSQALLKQCMNDAQKLVGVPVEEPLGPEENSEEAREKLSPSLSSSTEVRDNCCFMSFL